MFEWLRGAVAELDFEHVLSLHTVVLVTLMFHRHKDYFNRGYQFFLTDCCYLFNYALVVAYFWLYSPAEEARDAVETLGGLIAAASPLRLTPAVLRGALFVGATCYCGFGVVMWRNALLWGDYARFCSFYLHYAPAALVYVERHWYSPAAAGGVAERGFFAALFGGGGGDALTDAATLDYWAGARAFAAFFAACCALQAVIFVVALKSDNQWCSFRFMGNQWGAPRNSVAAFLYFNGIIQGLYIALTVFLGRYVWRSFTAHSLFVAALLLFALYQGRAVLARRARRKRRYGADGASGSRGSSVASSEHNTPTRSRHRSRHSTPGGVGSSGKKRRHRSSPRSKLLSLLKDEGLDVQRVDVDKESKKD